MLYLEGDTSHTWPAVATVLTAREPLHMVVQMYSPDDPPPEPFTRSSTPARLEVVTELHGDAAAPVSSNPLLIDDSLLASVGALIDRSLEDTGDLAMYRPGERGWVAAAIPHERMVLIRDSGVLGALLAAGLQVSSEPPEWW